MPVYTVELAVNVPGLGAKTVTQLDVKASDISDAIVQAKASVIIEPVRVVKTGV